MGADSTSRTLILLFALLLLGWAVWLIRDVLPPFLIAGALALLLDPFLDRMQRRGVPRWAAVLLTFSGFLLLFFGVLAYVIPRVAAQVAELIGNIDAYMARTQAIIDGWTAENHELLERLNVPPTVSEFWEQHQESFTAYLQQGLQGVFGTLQASAGVLGWIVIVPLVTLYLLMDLDALRARMSYLIPDDRRATVEEMAARVGRVFAAYLRGLILICMAYGTVVYLALALGFTLPYALILGLSAGVLYAVPYLGQMTLILITVSVAWATGRNPGTIIGIAVSLVVVGQLFDQLITPRFFGKQVGLHPVLGLFALMVGGHLFGLAGMVLAVPAAASVRVVLIQLFPRLTEPIPGFAKGVLSAPAKPVEALDPAPGSAAPGASATPE